MRPQERFKRAVWRAPTDPDFSEQWHLRGQHLRVVDAWRNHDVSGAGVNLAVVDDGLQHEHPDLKQRYVRSMSYDFNDDKNDPEPYRSDGHGTSAAGTAAASEDSNCGVGVAHGANLIGLRLLGSWTTDAEESQALCHMCDEDESIMIYSNSWGPSDEGVRLGPSGRMVQEAFAYCATNGRGGKGSIYVWAGGNGRFNDDNSNYDGYANSIYTIAVGAINVRGIYTWYSEPGANLLCAAPSSGVQGSSIVTTDLMSTWGYSNTGCTDDFGGTSAAAPQIAGVVALMLEAKPRLTWRDVQHILARTSRKTDARQTEWTENTAGFEHSHDYGFGMVDANAAVEAAQSWDSLTTGTFTHFGSDPISCNLRNTDYTSNTEKKYTWRASGRNDLLEKLEHVRVSVDIEASNGGRGCVRIVLTGPTGVSSTLQDRGPGQENSFRWTYDTVRHWGEPTRTQDSDKWVLYVKDVCKGAETQEEERWRNHVNDCRAVGNHRVNEWSIEFYGS
jgi:subtilisin family serine protease